ncbi:hypothetical protein PsorP6_015383 [Peronosclerospora sorghi]|uniref:Uncharacterized protein n=1 Tax=Peronosclerospora sorghi TaxID=230839 RepID=A0ACC0WPI7_9STRA|nr:hypothetical protein PsorP6_015383 [Peronosclerospora sorghi]
MAQELAINSEAMMDKHAGNFDALHVNDYREPTRHCCAALKWPCSRLFISSRSADNIQPPVSSVTDRAGVTAVVGDELKSLWQVNRISPRLASYSDTSSTLDLTSAAKNHSRTQCRRQSPTHTAR